MKKNKKNWSFKDVLSRILKSKKKRDTPINPVEIGKFIASIRTTHNMTQQQLADKIFISRKTVSKWESGRGLPNIDLLRPLSDELNISVDGLLNAEFINRRFATISGISSKILKSPRFRLSTIIAIMLMLFFILCYSILSAIAPRNYLVNYEDENFTLVNGIISMGFSECLVNFTNFTSYLLDEYRFEYELYYTEEDSSDEHTIVKFTNPTLVITDKDICTDMKNTLEDFESKKLFLKAIYTDENNVETYFRLDLSNSISRTFSLKPSLDASSDKSAFDDNDDFKLSDYNSPATAVMSDVSLDSIDVDFLFKMTPKELKECYDGRSIEIDGEEYQITYSQEDQILKVSISDKSFKIDFQNSNFVYNNDEISAFTINSEFQIIFNNRKISMFNDIRSLMNLLFKICHDR